MSNENQNGGLLLPVAGGLVTGGGAYLASQKIDKVKEWVSEPKYNSFEDIVKEADDVFAKEVENATEENKTLMEQIKAKREEIKNAETNWDKAKEQYIKDNTVLKQAEDTEEIKNLQKQLDDLKATVASKEQKYMNEEIAKLGKKPAKVKQDINTEKAIKAIEERLAQAKADQKTATEALNAKIDELVKTLPGNTASEASATAVKNAESALEAQIATIKGLSKEQRASLLKEAKIELQARAGLKDGVQAAQERLEIAKHNLESLPGNKVKLYDEKAGGMRRLIDADKKKLAELNDEHAKIQAKRRAHVKQQWAERQQARSTKVTTQHTVSHPVLGETSVKHTKQSVFNYKPFQPSKEEQAFLDTYKGKVKELETRIGAREEVFRLQDEVKKAQEGVANAGKARVEVAVPQTDKVATWKKSLDKFKNGATEVADSANVQAKAKEAVEAKLAGDKKAVTELAENIAKKREALPKVPTKTADELTEAFIKANGKREDAIANAAKNVGDDLKEGLKKLTKNNNTKLIAGIAGCAALGITLGALLRPKHKENA